MRVLPRRRRDAPVYTVTDARRPMSEDIGYRERRYLITMGVRMLCFALSILFAVSLSGSWRWLSIACLIGAVILPYIAVVFANGGREPDSSARFAPYDPDSDHQNEISGPRRQIGS